MAGIPRRANAAGDPLRHLPLASASVACPPRCFFFLRSPPPSMQRGMESRGTASGESLCKRSLLAGIIICGLPPPATSRRHLN